MVNRDSRHLFEFCSAWGQVFTFARMSQIARNKDFSYRDAKPRRKEKHRAVAAVYAYARCFFALFFLRDLCVVKIRRPKNKNVTTEDTEHTEKEITRKDAETKSLHRFLRLMPFWAEEFLPQEAQKPQN